jgi:predicted dehydrogenase
MIRSGEVDAVLIATPHYDHTTIGIDALQHGVHVLVEKPISVHVADAQRLIAAHTDPKVIFAAMFNQRTDPKYIKTKRLIASGEVGEIRRVQWTITDWFRPGAYYASGGWRATWRGEGGGVLLNQCPHNLDLLQWICGVPVKMLAFCRFGKYHDIEVDDDVTAYFEYPNGATGVFITTTGEAPGTNRLEIAGDRGKVVLEEGKITFTRTETPVGEFSRTSKATFGRPDVWNVEVPTPAGNGPQHAGITQNFVDAILDGAPLIARAEEGIHSLELANAMLYSTFLGRAVDLPLDAAGYEAQLKKLIATSRFEKKTAAADPTDVRTSFGS